jgi:hypothetical protein
MVKMITVATLNNIRSGMRLLRRDFLSWRFDRCKRVANDDSVRDLDQLSILNWHENTLWLIFSAQKRPIHGRSPYAKAIKPDNGN